MMRQLACILAGLGLASALFGCKTPDGFMPKSAYPPDPWVKGYSNPDDCIGGEKLAAMTFDLPAYPKKAYRTGRQGWTILRLDVDAQGRTQNVKIENSVPSGMFDGASRQAAKAWRFAPPQDGALQNCRVLLRYRAGDVTLGS